MSLLPRPRCLVRVHLCGACQMSESRLTRACRSCSPITCLAARLSPTGVGMKGLRRHDERDARGILSMANFGGAESGSRPQSPLETTKKLLHGLVGVAQGVGGDEAGVGFPWALLESVSSPADGAGNPADCEQRNSAGCEPRGPAGSSRAASPLLSLLWPRHACGPAARNRARNRAPPLSKAKWEGRTS